MAAGSATLACNIPIFHWVASSPTGPVIFSPWRENRKHDARSRVGSSRPPEAQDGAVGAIAESARGVSPRAAHRSGRDTLASSGSCHRTKTAAFRREMRALPVVSWPALNVGDLPPLLHGHYPASLLLQSSPPLPAASVLSASQVRCLCLFPWHRWTGSQVPYESPNESHASYTPGTAWPVGRFPPRSSWSSSATPVLMPPKAFRCVTRGSRSHISLIHT